MPPELVLIGLGTSVTPVRRVSLPEDVKLFLVLQTSRLLKDPKF